MKKWLLMALFGHVGFAHADSIESWVPQGWKIIQKAQGDLNKDGLADVALIIENTDSTNVHHNEHMGSPELNINPRHLLIVFQNTQGQYDLKLTQTKFIPSPDDVDASCLQDPLAESEPMSIKKGVLHIELNYFYSCGSWFITKNDYSFRYNGAAFALIGFDTWSLHRATLDVETESVNVLTGRKSVTAGENLGDGGDGKIKTRWQNFKFKQAWTLEQLDAHTSLE